MSSISHQSHHLIHDHCFGRATKRLYNEYKKFVESPPENIKVALQEDLILDWHFLFTGLNSTPFKGGEYHGMLIFPEDYPFSPPSIRFITPNGRFKTDERVCFDLSDFHPECWKPANTVSVVLQGVYSFMMSETTDTVGSLVMDKTLISSLARKSKDFNRKDKICNELFHNQFTSNLDRTNSHSNTKTTHTSAIQPNYSDEQNDSSESSPNILRVQTCISGTNTNSEFESANLFPEKQTLSPECTTFNTLDSSRPENPKSSEFGEIPTNKSRLNISEVPRSNLSMKRTKRISKEFQKIMDNPIHNIIVTPGKDLILEWHFLFTGLIDTPFKGGQYHGMLIFPEDYPFSPPSIRFITPNGRFNANERICFELSDFRSECWKPAYSVSAVLEGVYSFMMSETTDAVGSLEMDKTLIRSLARKSKEFNRKDKICNELFHNQFTSNLDRTNSYSNTKTTHTSAIQPNYSDEQNDSSESSPNILRVQTCISGTNTNSEFESANLFREKQTLSPECTTFNTLDSSRPENPKSSEFGEIPTSKSRLNISEVPRSNFYQSVSQQLEPPRNSSFSNKDNSNLSMKRTKRISKEFQKIMDNPIHNIIVTPGKDLILEWHFLFTGINDTPFEGGEYHGVLMFPQDYPFSPPSIRFITPNGRFNTNDKVHFELSDFHPECWKPAYTLLAVLQGVYSLLMSEPTDTVGSLEMDENEIRELARKSKEFNLKDGSAELFQNEKVALTENSDTDPTPSPINKPDISSQKDQSCSSPDLLEPDVSSKAVETSEITDIVGSLNVDENDINNPAEMSKAFYLNDSSAVFFKNEIMNGSNVDTNPRLNEKIRKNYIPSPRKIKSSSLPDTLKPTVSSKESQKTRDLASASSASFPDEKVSKIRNTRKNDEDISSRSQINKINSKTPRIDLQKETIASRDGKKLDKYKCTSIYHNSTNNPKVQSRPLSQKEEIGAQNFKMLKSIDIPRPKLENKYIISPFKYQ